MKKHKLHIGTILIIGICTVCFIFKNEVIDLAVTHFYDGYGVTVIENNEYANNFDFKLIQLTDDFKVKNEQDILNTIYTVLNSGVDTFTFYCPKEYTDCRKHLKKISNDQTLLSLINNMVSPYNSYKKLYITTNNFGKAKIEVDKLYTENDITITGEKIDEILKEVTRDNMSDVDKIKAYHDYFAKNTVYDEERATMMEAQSNEPFKYNSDKANGPLLEGFALCSGYSDVMKIYLDRLNIPNYKISTDNHIWNLVYIDGTWLHLDLTWNNPIITDGKSFDDLPEKEKQDLTHKFFLIDTKTLLNFDSTSHTFNFDYYPEAK